MRKFLLIIIMIFILCSLTACDKNITINFYDADELIESISCPPNSFPNFTPPKKEGYTFEDWYTDKDLSHKFTTDDKFDKDIDLYAKYIKNTYTVTFIAQGFDHIIKTVSHGETLTDIPAVPNKIGFDGKWENVDLSAINSNKTVNAIYTPIELKIIFKAKGFESIIKTVLYGQSLNDIPDVPSIEGKIGHWDIDDFTNITKNTVVNAVYQDKKVTVSFISQLYDQIYIETVEVLYNGDLPSSLIPEPYPFDGHYRQWEQNDLTSLKDDMEVYAVYTPFTFDISFYDYNDNLIVALKDVEYGSILKDWIENSDLSDNIKQELLTPNIPENLDSDANTNFRYGNEQYDSDIYTPVTRGGIYSLIFDTTIKVTVFANCGALIDDIDIVDGVESQYDAGVSFPYLDVKPRYGYEFLGWYTLDEYDPDNYEAENYQREDYDRINITRALYQNTMIIALWEKIYCDVAFPNIDDIDFLVDSQIISDVLTIEYGSDISFSINTQIQNYKVMANTLELIAYENLYTILQIDQDTVIAIETQDISIHTLSFYSEDKEHLLYSLNISHGQYLNIIPDIPQIYGAEGSWYYNLELEPFTFESPILEDMDFEIVYNYQSYPVYYYDSDNDLLRVRNVTYGDTSYKFWSPPKQGYLFDGWYLNSQHSQRATIEDVIFMGRPMKLYANWVEEKEYEHWIIGKWYNTQNNMILNFYENGLVAINDCESFFEYAYSIIENNIYILDNEIVVDGDNIIYMGISFEKTHLPVAIIEFDNIDCLTIVGDEIPYNQEIFEHYWYIDQDRRNMIDIYENIDFDLIENNYLKLYRYTKRLVKIYFDALDGHTHLNITSQFVYITQNNFIEFIYNEPDNIIIDNLLHAFRDNYIFVGWVVEGTNILMDYTYLLDNFTLHLNVKAKYITSDIGDQEHTIEGFYYSQEQQSIITAEFFDNGTYQITVIDTQNESFFRCVTFYYLWTENGFIDEDNNPIVLDNNFIILYIEGMEINLQKNELDVPYPYYINPLPVQEDYDFIEFKENSFILNMIEKNNVVKLGSILYYIEPIERQNNIIYTLITYNMDDFFILNQDIPQIYIGVFKGQIELESVPDEPEPIIISKQIIEIEITINNDRTAQLVATIGDQEYMSMQSLVFYYENKCFLISQGFDEQGNPYIMKSTFQHDEEQKFLLDDEIEFDKEV